MNKVWIINQFANTPELPGHTRQFEIAKYLANKDFEVELFASDFNLTERKFKKILKFNLSKRESLEKVNINWLRVIPYKKNNWIRKLNLISFCLHIFSALFLRGFRNFLLNNKKVIIIASTPQLPAAFFSLIISKIYNFNFILEVRDLWPQMLVDQGGLSKKSITYKVLHYMEKSIYKNASKIIVLAKGMEEHIYNNGGKNIIWLPNGPDLDQFKFSPLPNEELQFSQNRLFNIIYTGAHGESNDLYNVIETAKLLTKLPVIFKLIGDGTEKNNLIKQSQGLKNVVFMPPVAKKKIPKILKNADAILVSLKNTKLFSYGVSPNKLYDAYAIGRPVITTIPGDINNEVKKYFLGVTANASDPLSLSKAIKLLMNTSRSKREEMSRNARVLSETIYSREIINSKYCKILDEFIR